MTTITSLYPILASQLAANDVVPVVDVSQGVTDAANMKIAMGQLASVARRFRPDGSAVKTPPKTADIGSVWTLVSDSTPNSISVTDSSEGFVMDIRGHNNGNWYTRHYARSLPSTPYTVTLEADPVVWRGDTYSYWGLGLRDSATGRNMMVGQQSRQNNIFVNYCTQFSNTYSNAGDGGFFANNDRTMPNAKFVRIYDNGSTVQPSFSADGIHWFSYSAVSRTLYAANPTQLTFFAGIYNDGTSPLQVVFKDFYIS